MNACESILGLSPYQGGKPIEELARELGLTKISKLASNENPLGISIKVKRQLMTHFRVSIVTQMVIALNLKRLSQPNIM